jgi:hypothetical protein
MAIVTLLLSSSFISKTHGVPRRRHFSRSIGWRIEEGSADCDGSIAARLAIAVVRRYLSGMSWSGMSARFASPMGRIGAAIMRRLALVETIAGVD